MWGRILDSREVDRPCHAALGGIHDVPPPHELHSTYRRNALSRGCPEFVEAVQSGREVVASKGVVLSIDFSAH